MSTRLVLIEPGDDGQLDLTLYSGRTAGWVSQTIRYASTSDPSVARKLVGMWCRPLVVHADIPIGEDTAG